MFLDFFFFFLFFFFFFVRFIYYLFGILFFLFLSQDPDLHQYILIERAKRQNAKK